MVESSSLVPADLTSLFTSAGMQQFVPYLSGEREPPFRRACSAQKCVRVNDIEEVGDETHHTFFEMLGNWSFGDYFKKKAVDYALEFLIEECGFKKEKLWITIFEGEGEIPRDTEAEDIWIKKGFPKERIFEYGAGENFWGPVSKTGPCGPCSEIFYDLTGEPCGKKCHPNCECGRFVEVWNLVFMEYNKKGDGSFGKLSQQNVDTGMGFERMVALLEGKSSPYRSYLFRGIIEKIEELSGKKYENEKRRFRIIADHVRASSFIVADGVLPSNSGRGYVLRMLLRRMLRHLMQLEISSYEELIEEVVDIYGDFYEKLEEKEDKIKDCFRKENKKFQKTLKRGLKKFEELVSKKKEKRITGREAFDLYQSYGFPLELTVEMAEEKGFKVEKESFKKAMKEHKEKSRKGASKKFGGVGISELENEEEIKKAKALHTTTHLLQASLRRVLGKHVKQMGSDVSSERLRFDFSHPEALTDEEIKKVERLINEKIKEGLKVTKKEMPYKKALQSGALAFFKARYPKEVFVYTIGDPEDPFSKEICAGPHIQNTGEIEGRFAIIKENSAGAGIRRIRGVFK